MQPWEVIAEKLLFRGHVISARQIGARTLIRVMVEFGTSSTFRGWVRVKILGYGSRVRGRKVKSRDCALASDLVKATASTCATYWLEKYHAQSIRYQIVSG